MQERWRDIAYAHPDPLLDLHGYWGESAVAQLATAASLRPALLAPESGAVGWLREVQEELSLANASGELLHAVVEFAQRGVAFDPTRLAGSLADETRRMRLADVAREMHEWREQTTQAKTAYATATRVMKHLASSASETGAVVEAVLAGDPNAGEAARQLLARRLASERLMKDYVSAATSVGRGPQGKAKEIRGQPLDQILRRLEHLQNILERWLRLTRVGQESSDDWRTREAVALRERFMRAWPQVEQEPMTGPGGDGDEVACVMRAVPTIVRTLAAVAQELFFGPDGGTVSEQGCWQEALRRPLLLISPPPAHVTDPWSPEAFRPQVSLLSAVLEGRTLRQAFDLHLDSGYPEVAEMVLTELERVIPEESELLHDLVVAATTKAERALAARLEEVHLQVERGFFDHSIGVEDYSHLQGRLLSAEQEASNGRRHFSEIMQEVCSVEGEIASLRHRREQSLRDLLTQIREELGGGEGPTLAEDETRLRCVEKAEEALVSGDLPRADEYLTYAEIGGAPSQSEDLEDSSVVEQFCAVQEDIQQALQRHGEKLVNMLKNRKRGLGIDMGQVPGARDSEIDDGLRAYWWIKRQDTLTASGMMRRNITQVLTYLGFHEPNVSMKRIEEQAAHFAATMKAGTLSPLPEWGSLCRDHYDVVLARDRPSAEMLAQAITRFGLSASNPIILFFGRLTQLQREEWSAYCRQHKMSALLIDEVLLHFLASRRQTRLPAAISCGVTWGYANPYRSSGAIPPEIFKGRHHMVVDIAKPMGTSLVYGGRQFGKSALLRTVQRTYHCPEQGVFVLYEDIKTLGDPEGHHLARDIWVRLRDDLATARIVQPTASESPDALGRRVLDVLEQKPTMRILVLLDEADSFLQADAKENFPEVHELRRIIDASQGRFKVVFCGLHSVQRFCARPNHPFAQLGNELVVGPLEPRAALELIQGPMAAIGFALGEDVALRILCYTNYHPALIQQFCLELVTLVRQRLDRPPYVVTMADVEAVYRKAEVRGFMRERFEWTLRLDERYTAMVYAMVAAQFEDMDGYRREFTTGEALEIAKSHWPAGFAYRQLDEAKSLLDELVGLGVLVRRDNGKYRLRNGNVARLLGAQDEIRDKLEQLATKPAPVEFDPDQTRFVISEEGERRSPLTQKQAGELTRPRSGVGLVFGSEALHRSGVLDALGVVMRVARRDGQIITTASRLSPHVSSLREVEGQLQLQRAKKAGRYLLYAPANHLALTQEGLHTSVAEINRVLSKYKSRQRSVRFIVSFGAADLYRWLIEESGAWEGIENTVDATAVIARWSRQMVEKLLESKEVPCTDLIVDDVMAITGGWPWLLFHFRQGVDAERDKGHAPDPRRVARQLRERLQDDSELRAAFVDALEVDDVPYGAALLHLIQSLEPIEWDDIPYLLETSGEPTVQNLPLPEARAAVQTLARTGLLDEGEDGLRVEPVAAAVVLQEAVASRA
jgi:hypothetical protein